MKRFLCVTLTLMLALSSLLVPAALAESVDDFFNGSLGYNSVMPSALSAIGVKEEMMEEAVTLYTLSYDADATGELGHTTYSSGMNMFYVIIVDDSDPSRELYVGSSMNDDELVPLIVTPFVFFFALKIGATDGSQIGDALDWFQGGYQTTSSTRMLNYEITYSGEGDVTIFHFVRQ